MHENIFLIKGTWAFSVEQNERLMTTFQGQRNVLKSRVVGLVRAVFKCDLARALLRILFVVVLVSP